jgi:predicted DNA-binding transcriptional regulator AlpA
MKPVDERIAIFLDGRPFGLSRISELSRESIAGLLIQLAAVHTAIAERLCNGFRTAEHDANEKSAAGIDGEKRAPEQSGIGRSSASTVNEDRGMDHATLIGPRRSADEKPYLSVKQTAAKIGNSQWTLYHWIESGKLDEAHGLRRLGSRRLIDWQVFQGCLERGEFN